jgi:molybdopterin-guanine dinucleotide biosynthesis protein A
VDAIVLAGGLVPTDRPWEGTEAGTPKCLVDVAGKAMVQWVLDALGDATGVGRVVVVGLPEDTTLDCARPLALVPGEPDLIGSVQAAAERLLADGASSPHALLVSADAPLVTGEMIDWLHQRVAGSDDDLTICTVERSTMEDRFPGSRRTYVRLKGLEVCGGDVNACRLSVTRRGSGLAERLAQARKQPWRMALTIGFGTLLALLLGRLTLDQGVRAINRRLGVNARVLVSPHAEMGMDVDKPSQLELVRAELAGRA